MYKIILQNGQTLEDLDVNGSYFITSIKITRKFLEDNLFNVVVEGEYPALPENPEDFTDAVYPPIPLGFYKVMKLNDFVERNGKIFFAIADVDPEEMKFAEINAKIDYLAMMTDTDM